MICPNCQTKNPDGAKFCNECGTKLPASCPNCGQHNPPGAKFCNECGHSLAHNQPAPPSPAQTTTEAPAAQATLPHSMSRTLADKLTEARNTRAMEGERRIVTILFCDVKGSTAAAEQLDPEEWADIMNGVFEQMIQPVYKYQGTVVRLLGDAVLAFFGAPIAHEDDPQRAVLAGLEILQAISDYRTEVHNRWNIELDVRCGINTGLVVVGAIGSDQHLEYSALGDAVNLAARMEQTAQPGTLQIAEETYRLVAPLFDVEELGAIEVKGKLAPVHTYRVVGAKAGPQRLRRIEGLESPLVGRDPQFSVLRSALQRLQQGVGSIVFLVGEAGLGKSRLIHEMRLLCEALEAGPAWFETTSRSYELSQPYGQFQRLMRSVCAINRDDAPYLARQKIGHLLAEVAIEEPEATTRAMEALLNLEETSTPRLEGETFKAQLHSAMRRLWQTMADGCPTVLVFDDLHWADPASNELLQHLFGLSDRTALLIVCAMRPDRQTSSWDVRVEAESRYPHRYTEIKLEPLSEEESNTLMDNLLGVSGLPQSLQASMQEKAAGNPFFVEEVVHSLIDSGALVINEQNQRLMNEQSVAHIDIPDNLHSLILARIDRLEQTARQTMQLAAVIGRSFHYRVLARIAGDDATDLRQQLLQLQKSDLIHEAARVPELEYIFKHVLVQEAAYNMILNRQRRQYHQRVGETLESLFPDHLEENASLLAYHFDEARAHGRALHYHRMAGDAAYRLFARREASDHYGRALALAKQFVSDTQAQGQHGAEYDELYGQLQYLYTQLGRVFELSAQFDRALAIYKEMEALAREHDRPALKLAALMAQATLYAIPSPVQNMVRGEALSDEALDLTRELGDRAAEAKVLWILMWIYIDTHRQLQALDSGKRSLAIARELDLREQMAFTLSDLGSQCYIKLGRFEECKAVLRDAIELWREFDNLPMLADSQGTLCWLHVYSGEYDQAIALSEDIYQLSQSIGNVWGQSYSRMRIGLAHWERGWPDQAIAAMEESLHLGESSGFVVPQVLVRADLASVYGQLGLIERGLKAAHIAHTIAEENYPLYLPYTLGTLTQLYSLHGNYIAAEALVVQSKTDPNLTDFPIYYGPFAVGAAGLALRQGNFEKVIAEAETLLEIGFQIYVPHALYLQGQALLGLGQEEIARQRLLKARSEAEAIDSRWILWRILYVLSQLATDKGEAQILQRQSRQMLQPIAEAIPIPELRASFLTLPHVQALLS